MTSSTPGLRLDRPRPPLGGFNTTLIGLETRRLLRNKRTLMFTILLPVVFYIIFGLLQTYAGRYGSGNYAAYVAISMALYGSALATTAGGSTVSIERAQGWSRQLRLTPLSPFAYIMVKAITAMSLGLASTLAVYIVALITGKADMPASAWVLTGLTVWIGSLLFAVFGLFMGYLLPTENVMQLLSFALVVFAFAGGVFIPVVAGSGFEVFASFTPMYGINQLAHAWLQGQPFNFVWVINAVAWLVIFAAGAAWRFGKDTARV
ncbi:MAG: ABC transporter permease [Antricoccus sp.]